MEETTPKDSNSQKNKRIAKNTLMLYFRMILTMLVALYTSRVVLNTLGVEDYGIYNVVGGVVAMFGFFNSAMSSATQRFLSFELGRGDFVQLRKTFNAAQVIHIGIAILIFILAETVGLWFVKNYLVIPAERMEAALWVYHFSILSFMVTIIQVPYNATIIAHERMNVYAYISILEVSLKLLIVFMLTWISYDKLKLYGILQLVVFVIITAVYRIYVRINFEEAKFQVVKDKELYKSLTSYSGWTLFATFAGVAKGQGVNILLNLFFGPVINAARGVAMQVQYAINNFASNFQTAIKPQIFKSYAADEKDYMTSLVFRSSKFSFYLLFLLSLPIMLEANQIIKLWLKSVPEYTPLFTILVLIIAQIVSISNPLGTAVQATGKIKTFHILLGLLLLLIIPISYLFLKLGYPPEVTLYVTIVIEILALFYRLFYLKRLIDFPIQRFIENILLKNILIAVLSISLPLIIRNIMDENIVRLLVLIFLSFVWSAVIISAIGLTKGERQFILSKILATLNKIK